MSTMNRLGNVFNPYQTTARKVLCVCSAGLLRSPTAANALHSEFGYNTRAAGVSEEYALIPVDEVMLTWADEIVCVEASVATKLINFMTANIQDPDPLRSKITVLNIPDMYEWGNPTLKAMILEQYREVGGT